MEWQAKFLFWKWSPPALCALYVSTIFFCALGYFYVDGLADLVNSDDSMSRLVDSFYFSCIAQSTVGFGDIKPRGFGKLIASFQGLFGNALVALIFFRIGENRSSSNSKRLCYQNIYAVLRAYQNDIFQSDSRISSYDAKQDTTQSYLLRLLENGEASLNCYNEMSVKLMENATIPEAQAIIGRFNFEFGNDFKDFIYSLKREVKRYNAQKNVEEPNSIAKHFCKERRRLHDQLFDLQKRIKSHAI